MRVEVVERPTGLLLIHVPGKEKLACEAAYNRFLLSHGLKEWVLVVRMNLLDRSLVAQSINPGGEPSAELVIGPTADIRAHLTELLEAELNNWLARSPVFGSSGSALGAAR